MRSAKYINLRKIEENDINKIYEWLTRDDYLMALSGSKMPSQIESKIDSMLETKQGVFARESHFIVESKKGVPIGFVSFGHIDWRHKALALDIYIASEYQNAVFGYDTLMFSVCYAYYSLNMQNVEFYVNQFNKNVLGIAKKTCFHQGTLRQQVYIKGKYWNVEVYRLTKGEFEKNIAPKFAKKGFEYVKVSK